MSKLNDLERQRVLDEVAEDAFDQVNEVAQALRETSDAERGGSGIDMNLYVYPNGQWLITNNCDLNDHNTLAQASAEVAYGTPKDLAAALAETVADAEDLDEPSEDDWCTSGHAKFYELREVEGGSYAPGKMVVGMPEDFTPEQMWTELIKTMKQGNFFPNVWFIDDHGGMTLMEPPAELTKASV